MSLHSSFLGKASGALVVLLFAALSGGWSQDKPAVEPTPEQPAERIDPVLQKRINQAIDKGVAFLRQVNFKDENNIAFVVGRRALIGWTLLECGVPAKDELVQELATLIRKGAIESPSDMANYSLTTALIFLDKLGDAVDEPLIESLAVRILAAQSSGGGWGYAAPALSAAERERLTKELQDRRAEGAEALAAKKKKRTPEQAMADLKRYAQRLDWNSISDAIQEDNSNTQFAMMALWVARRHDVPVTDALSRTGKRLRNIQTSKGAWLYHDQDETNPSNTGNMHENPYPALTCAGLFGLALEKGAQGKAKDALKDPAGARAMAYLEKYVNKLAGAAPQNAAPDEEGAPRGIAVGGGSTNYYYFLFSLERMAVVYNIKTIGQTDWYLWGAQQLVNSQHADGNWVGGYTTWGADTCFALLFLKRANIAQDLTNLIKGIDRRPPETKSKEPLKLPMLIPKDDKKPQQKK